MKLVNYEYDIDLNLDFGLNFIVLENKRLFRECIKSIKENINLGTGKFVLSNNNKDVDLHKKGVLIADSLNLNFDNTHLVKSIYDDMQKELSDENHLEKTFDLKNQIRLYIESLISDYDLVINYEDEFDMLKILKAVDLKIDYKNEDTIEQLIIYIRAVNKLLDIRYFFFVNLAVYFDEEELELLEKECQYSDVVAILIENRYNNYSRKNIICFDGDLCRII